MKLNPFPRGLSWQIPLNRTGAGIGPDAGRDLAARLQALLLSMKGDCYDPDTGRVDYGRIRNDPRWKEVRGFTAALNSFDPAVLATVQEKKAFWINLYNALVIDAVVSLGIRETVWEVPMLFSRAGYGIGGRFFSADMIEHGILRANSKPPYPLSKPCYSQGSPEIILVVRPLDPRIHFALVCGAKGCPSIRFYEPERLDEQLDLATRAFVNGGTRIDRARGEVTVSRIFKWYAADFGGLESGPGRGLAGFLAQFIENSSDGAWLRTARVRFRFSDYNWKLNG